MVDVRSLASELVGVNVGVQYLGGWDWTDVGVQVRDAKEFVDLRGVDLRVTSFLSDCRCSAGCGASMECSQQGMSS